LQFLTKKETSSTKSSLYSHLLSISVVAAEAFINKILYLIKNCNGIIDDDVIERNPVLAEKLYEVQYCDIMAQDTKYLKDRVDYLTTTNYKLKKRRSRLYKKR
jgi:hypothetical protein